MPLGTNVDVVRVANQKLILDLIRQEPISRAELSDKTGLTRACITQISGQLIQMGLIRECDTIATRRGRHPVLLELVPSSRHAIGINIRRSRIHVGITNLVGELLSEATIDSKERPANALCEAAALEARRQLQALRIPQESLLGVGVCAPGPMDFQTGTILHAPRFDAWHDFPLASVLENLLQAPVYLENISNALALAEKYYGNAKNYASYLALQVNEGIGGGILLENRLYRGAHGMASEVGHISIEQNGRPCACGNRGCLECYASIPAILSGSSFASWADLMDALETSPEAQSLLCREADALACALSNVMNLFDLEHIFLLGDIAYKPNALLTRIAEGMQSRLFCRKFRGTAFLSCGAAQNNALAGAMPCLDHFFRPGTSASLPSVASKAEHR